jgi:hypothetical protein
LGFSLSSMFCTILSILSSPQKCVSSIFLSFYLISTEKSSEFVLL